MRGESQRFFEIFQANVYFIYEKPLTKCVNLVSGYVGWRTCLFMPEDGSLADVAKNEKRHGKNQSSPRRLDYSGILLAELEAKAKEFASIILIVQLKTFFFCCKFL